MFEDLCKNCGGLRGFWTFSLYDNPTFDPCPVCKGMGSSLATYEDWRGEAIDRMWGDFEFELEFYGQDTGPSFMRPEWITERREAVMRYKQWWATLEDGSYWRNQEGKQEQP